MMAQAQDSNVGERSFGLMFDSNVGATGSSGVQNDVMMKVRKED